MPKKLLKNKVIFVTGGGQGIGRECALAYSREGATVVIADLNLEAARLTVTDLETKGLAIECNVGDGKAVESAIEQLLNNYGRLDAVHNNAGIANPSKPIHETSETEWDNLHQINLKSVYWTTRYALSALKENRGCILNTASMVGIIGQTDHAAYVSTKGAMIALTKAMALDYAPFQIRVNAICPAGVWTPLLRQWAAEQPGLSGIENYMNDIHALGYCPEADVIADAATFLLSDMSRFITGCILPVSGGAELGYRR